MKPENRFIARVHKFLPTVYHLKNHNVFNAGVPDVYYDGVRGCIWVEYKWQPKNSKTRLIQTGLTPLQQAWLSERSEGGTEVWLVVGTPGSIYLWGCDETTSFDAEMDANKALIFDGVKALAEHIHNCCGDRAWFNKLAGKLPTPSGMSTAGSSQ